MKTEKPAGRHASAGFLEKQSRRRPTLPQGYPCSTIGGSRLNFRVRNGNGWIPAPMTTGKLGPGCYSRGRRRAASWITLWRRNIRPPAPARRGDRSRVGEATSTEYPANGSFFVPTPVGVRVMWCRTLHASGVERINGQASRQISIGQLHASQRFHTRPIDLVVFQVPSGVSRPREISSRGGFHA